MQEYLKKILGSGNNTTLIISNNEIEDIIKIVKSLEDSGLLLKGVSEIIQNEAKKQKRGFLSMLLDTLGTSLLKNILVGKGAIAKRQSQRDKVEESIQLEKELYELVMERKPIFNAVSSFN